MDTGIARAVSMVVLAYARALAGISLIVWGALLGLLRDATVWDGQLLAAIVLILAGGWLLLPKEGPRG